MSVKYAVVYEASEDFIHATELADRVLREAVFEKSNWILDSDELEFYRTWIGEHEPQAQLTWKSIPAWAAPVGIRITGFIDGEKPKPEAKTALRAIRYIQRRYPEIGAIVLVHDIDRFPERRSGFEQARAQHPRLPIAIGLAASERECWIICSLEPRNERENRALAAEHQGLGFDPRIRSEDLSAGKDENAPNSAKRVCKALTSDDWDRARACWMETDLNILRARGANNGLAAYMSDVAQHLAPLIGADLAPPINE